MKVNAPLTNYVSCHRLQSMFFYLSCHGAEAAPETCHGQAFTPLLHIVVHFRKRKYNYAQTDGKIHDIAARTSRRCHHQSFVSLMARVAFFFWHRRTCNLKLQLRLIFFFFFRVPSICAFSSWGKGTKPTPSSLSKRAKAKQANVNEPSNNICR